MARDGGETKRVDVGFSGGQLITLRLSDNAFEDLRKAVVKRDGWHEVDSADGRVALDLGQVVFVKREPDEHRVGFSGPAL
jgi:hypothetical protein